MGSFERIAGKCSRRWMKVGFNSTVINGLSHFCQQDYVRGLQADGIQGISIIEDNGASILKRSLLGG